MANQTITNDANLVAVIANGLNNGQNITINAGAILTVDSPITRLIGQITINKGELLLDGAQATDPIIWVGEESEEINVNGAGILRSTLGWWEFPTTSNGLANQTFDCSTYFTTAMIDSDVFSGVWVETGRRINYNSGVGISPKVGDWLYDANDQSTHGRIEAISGDGVSGHVIVTFLTGALSTSDTIELHTIQDNNGPDYQKSWTATVSSPDVLEPGVYQPFGNAHQNSIDNLGITGSGMAGFAFNQAWKSNTLTFGNGTNGFIPPNGAKIRVPMVHFATGTITSVGINEPTWPTTTSSKYELETVNGGDCFLNGISLGSSHFEDSLGTEFNANYCAANHAFGIYASLSKSIYKNCIFVASIVQDTSSTARSLPAISDLSSGSLVEDCISVALNDTGETTNMGCQTSFDVEYNRNIVIGLNNSTEVEFLRTGGIIINDLVVIGTQLVFNTATNVDLKLLKSQRNLDGSVDGSDTVTVGSNCNTVKLVGWEILNNSCANDSKIAIYDSSNVKVYGFHFIDDKFDNEALGLIQGEEFTVISGLSVNILIARCWLNRGTPNEFTFITSGTCKNVTILNCSGEYTGEIEPDGINTSFRGLHGGSGNLGSGTGLETDYPGTGGAHFGDVFESDTAGYIYYRNVPGTPEYPITIISGNPSFTRDGDVDVILGDQWEVDMGYVALGHNSFTGVLTTIRNGGTVAEGGDQWTGVDIDFQYDNDGSGYNGAWLDLRTPTNLTNITDTVDGIRLKLRFTANTSQTNGQVLTIHTTTTIQSQKDNLYPLDQVFVPISVTCLNSDGLALENVRVRILNSSTNDIILEGLTDINGVISIPQFEYISDINIVGVARLSSTAPFYKSTNIIGTITSTGLDITATMTRDE